MENIRELVRDFVDQNSQPEEVIKVVLIGTKNNPLDIFLQTESNQKLRLLSKYPNPWKSDYYTDLADVFANYIIRKERSITQIRFNTFEEAVEYNESQNQKL